MSSGQAHNVQVRVLALEDHVALAEAKRWAARRPDQGQAVSAQWIRQEQHHHTWDCLRKREPFKPCQADAYLNLGQDRRRMMVNAGLAVVEMWEPPGGDDGVGPVRLAVETP